MATDKIATIGVTQFCILLYKQACMQCLQSVYDTHTCPIRYYRKLFFYLFSIISIILLSIFFSIINYLVEIKNVLNSLFIWQTSCKTEICLYPKDLQVHADP